MKNKIWKSRITDLFYLSLMALFFLIFRLGRGSLASWDEAIYAQISKNIVRMGEWFYLTSWEGHPWVEKPVLGFWCTAISYKLFGISEFSARFFSAFCGAVTVIVTYLLGEKLYNRWTGLLGACVLLSTSHYIRSVRFGMMDGPVTLFMTLALYFLWRGLEKDRYLILSGVMIGLGFLVKSLTALLVVPVIGIFLWVSGHTQIFRKKSYWLGLGIALGMMMIYCLYAAFVYKDIFFRELFKNLVERSTSAIEGHQGNYYFYIRTLINKYHPWILIGIFSGPLFLWKAIQDRKKESIFLAVWMFFILGVITLMRTKLHWYVVPLYPALSISVGYVLAKMIQEKHRGFVLFAFFAAMILHVHYTHIFNADYSRPIKAIAPAVGRWTPGEATVYLHKSGEQPAAIFYFERKVAYLQSPDEVVSMAKNLRNFFCVIHKNDLSSIADRLKQSGVIVLDSYEDVRLIGRAKMALRK